MNCTSCVSLRTVEKRPYACSVPQCMGTGLSLNSSTSTTFGTGPLDSTAQTKNDEKNRCRHGGVFRQQGTQSGSPGTKDTPAQPCPRPVEILELSWTLIQACFYHAPSMVMTRLVFCKTIRTARARWAVSGHRRKVLHSTRPHESRTVQPTCHGIDVALHVPCRPVHCRGLARVTPRLVWPAAL